MTNTGPGTARRQSVLDYGLSRRGIQVDPKDTQFMEPYLNSPGKREYSGFRIYMSQEMLHWYAVSPLLNSYITIFVELTLGHEIGAERHTSMRYRDMMVDNYLAAGGNLKTWRYIGTNGISNEPTRFLIEECFLKRGGDFAQPGSVEFRPSDEEFTSVTLGNPFTRGIQGLLREYEEDMGKAKIKRVVFVSEGPDGRYGLENGPELHLVVELCRPGDDGYPNDQGT